MVVWKITNFKKKNWVKRTNFIKTFLVFGILIMSSLGISVINLINEPGIVAFRTFSAGASAENILEASGLNQNNRASKIAIVPSNETLSIFIGTQDVKFDIKLKSQFIDDDNDQNGDNVLYNVTVTSTDAGVQEDNLQRYDHKLKKFTNWLTPVFVLNTRTVAPSGHDRNANCLYTKGNYGPWKYVANHTNSYLDANNNGRIDGDPMVPTTNPEYWAIKDGEKSFGDFEFNINPNATPGYYRMKFKVSFKYQQTQNVNTSGLGNYTNHASPTMASQHRSLTSNQALGLFRFYFWCPWDGNNFPANVSSSWGTGTLDYRKFVSYQESGDQLSWEGLRDNGVDVPNSYYDLDNDGFGTWFPGGDPNLAAINADYVARISGNYPGPPPIIDQSGTNPSTGNGTWTYSGRVASTDWGDPVFHTEDVWFEFKIESSIESDADLNEDYEANDLKLYPTDGNYYTGNVYEKFYLEIKNIDPNLDIHNIKTKLIPPLNNNFIFYNNQDVAINPLIISENSVKLFYNMSINPITIGGTYFGQLELKYTKHFTTDVSITENFWTVQFNVDNTPKPKAPDNFDADPIPKGNALNISWTPENNLVNYTIWSNITGTWKELINISHPTFWYIHSNLTDGIKYHYKLQAWNDIMIPSEYTNVIMETPQDSLSPKTPSSLIVEALFHDSLFLKWSPNSESDLKGYDIFRREGIEKDFIIINTQPVLKNFYNDTNLTADTKFVYKIRAFDEVPNYSDFSAEVSNTTLKSQKEKATCNCVGDNVSINKNITIEFDEPMNQTSVKNAFSINPPINGTFIWSKNGTILKFIPKNGLSALTHYTITISENALNSIGNPLGSKIIWSFTTGEELWPRIISYSPTGNNVQINTTITVRFSQIMNKESVEQSFTITNNVVGEFKWDGNRLIFTPETKLKYGTTYKITIDSGAMDIFGRNIQNEITWEFTTEKESVKNKSQEDTKGIFIVLGIFCLFVIIIILIVAWLRIKRK